MSEIELIEKKIMLKKQEIDGLLSKIVDLCSDVSKLEAKKKEILKAEKELKA